jgi:hypothetical protein
MTWNPKTELVRKATELAKEKHPGGFNKEQLIQASKEVYGGHAENPYKSVKTEEDIVHKRNYFANIDGHYPASMSDCETVGISGDCGYECPVFLRGDCKEHGKDMLEGNACQDINELDDMDGEVYEELLEIYGASRI